MGTDVSSKYQKGRTNLIQGTIFAIKELRTRWLNRFPAKVAQFSYIRSFAYLRFVHSDIMRCYKRLCQSLVAWSVYTTNCIFIFSLTLRATDFINLLRLIRVRTSCLLKRHSAKDCRDLTNDCLLKNCRFKEFCNHQMYFGYKNQIKWTSGELSQKGGKCRLKFICWYCMMHFTTSIVHSF